MRSSEGSRTSPTSADPVVVALPGTGSDADYASRAFGSTGLPVVAVDPDENGLVRGYERALDRAAADHTQVIAAGISIGACVAVQWALSHPAACAGVLAALPPWLGSPRTAPAAHSAAWTAALIRTHGLEETIRQMSASSPAWLSAELDRSWRAAGPHLVSQLDEAANYVAPTAEVIAGLRVPLSIVAVSDDPVHPAVVAKAWHDAADRSVSTEISMARWGADPALLGRLAIRGWRDLTAEPG